LIDESQDTNRELMEAFLFVQYKHTDEFSLGLLGDTKQRIYGGGKEDLGTTNWSAMGFATPAKPINHRSGSRIIEFANRIGNKIDQTPTQTPVKKMTKELFVCLLCPQTQTRQRQNNKSKNKWRK
jgi:DNA helicase-2/ATP-dependent DNA helicase PcrA